jgi:hypothetical protein
LIRNQPVLELRQYAGKFAYQWLDIFLHCHSPSLTGLAQWTFPDGRSLYDQPNYLPEIFRLINGQIGIQTEQVARQKNQK